MSIIISDEQLNENKGKLLEELQRVLQPDRIELLPNLALLATVGEGMAQRVGVAGTLFEALRRAEVNVRMISQGASEINIIVGVDGSEYERAMQAVYSRVRGVNSASASQQESHHARRHARGNGAAEHRYQGRFSRVRGAVWEPCRRCRRFEWR